MSCPRPARYSPFRALAFRSESREIAPTAGSRPADFTRVRCGKTTDAPQPSLRGVRRRAAEISSHLSTREGHRSLDANRNGPGSAAGAGNANAHGHGSGSPTRRHRFPFLGARWLSADPAAVFDALLVRPSRSTFDAALAARALVFLPRAISVTPSDWTRSDDAPQGTYKEVGLPNVASYLGDFRERFADWRTIDLLTARGVRDRSFLAAGVPNDDFANLAFMAAVRCREFFNEVSLPRRVRGTYDYGSAPS